MAADPTRVNRRSEAPPGRWSAARPAGRPGLLTGEHVRSGAVVVDVGTNVLDNGDLVGAVEPTSTTEVAAALTPVPGGVGTVTTALLVLHTTQAALRLSDALSTPPDARDGRRALTAGPVL